MKQILQLLTLYSLSLVTTTGVYLALFLERWERIAGLSGAKYQDIIFGVVASISQLSVVVFLALLVLAHLIDSKKGSAVSQATQTDTATSP
jgi:hypothetical protein